MRRAGLHRRWLLPAFPALMALALLGPTGHATDMPRVGILVLEAETLPHPETDALVQGLADLGNVDGRNIALIYRWANHDESLLPGFAAELVARDVSVIVALAPPALRAAQNATHAIPIVMRSSIDPVKAGFVASLAHPGGNITGVTSITSDLYGKRLELLKELVPGLSRVAILWNRASDTAGDYMAEVEASARSLDLSLIYLGVTRPEDFKEAFASARGQQAQALLPLRDPLVVGSRALIADLARENRLPAIYDDREYVEASGLLSYGANLTALHRRAAYYVDRILKGAKPSDLPVEQASVLELVINLRTARAMEFAIPPSILARADEVIE